MTARDARSEAQRLLGEGLTARVLEPSPPAVGEEPWFADDPVQGDGARAGTRLVVPVPLAGAITWDDWLADRPEHDPWACERWLGAHRRLGAPPPGYGETCVALHRVAVYAVAPARRRANGKIGLRWTLGGFGTPFFGDDEQVRVEGERIVAQRGGDAVSERLTTLDRAAAVALGGPPDVAWAEGLDVPPPGDTAADLAVDPAAARFLGDWFGFAYSVLEELRADPASAGPGRVQLWPEHFDAAVDVGVGARRATFGASPGDAAVPEPYLYALAPEGVDAGDIWNATAFRGAMLTLSGLVGASDQRAAALAFFRRRRDALEA